MTAAAPLAPAPATVDMLDGTAARRTAVLFLAAVVDAYRTASRNIAAAIVEGGDSADAAALLVELPAVLAPYGAEGEAIRVALADEHAHRVAMAEAQHARDHAAVDVARDALDVARAAIDAVLDGLGLAEELAL